MENKRNKENQSAEEWLAQERKRIIEGEKALMNKAHTLGREMINLVKERKIELKHSHIVGDYIFLTYDEEEGSFLVIGPDVIGHAKTPALDSIKPGIPVAHLAGAVESMQNWADKANSDK